MTTAVVICPGRGSYGPPELGTLKRHHPGSDVIARLDALRSAEGLEPLSKLDAAARFSQKRHGAGAPASALIYACTLADFHALAPHLQVVAVTGNSMGWYSALACAGAMTAEDGHTLVHTMGSLMEAEGEGGQLLHPVMDEDWRPAPGRKAAILTMVADIGSRPGHVLAPSIDLGGYTVLAGNDAGLDTFATEVVGQLPGYPVRLTGHAAFHSELVAPVAAAGQARLGPQFFGQPRLPLIDGRGAIWWPGATDPAALRDYTLGHQVTRPYDFTAALRTAAREFAPDLFILTGPGAALGGAVAQALILAHWRGMTCRVDFRDRQATAPVLAAMGRPEQRAPLIATGG